MVFHGVNILLKAIILEQNMDPTFLPELLVSVEIMMPCVNQHTGAFHFLPVTRTVLHSMTPFIFLSGSNIRMSRR